MVNLDYLAAKYAGEVDTGTERMENAATSALNILHEQGIYAMVLWLREKGDKSGKNGEYKILEGLDRLFHDPMMPFHFDQAKHVRTPADVRDQLTRNLKTMFFAKNLIELYLIYVRHLAKAAIKEG